LDLSSELNGASVSATLAKITRGELVESTHPGIVVADDGSPRALRLAAAAVNDQLGLAEAAILETLQERHPEPGRPSVVRR
jgi:L-asparaginase II